MQTAFERTVITTLIPETCCSCGVLFGLEQDHRNTLLRSQEFFHCPNGHPQHFTGASPEAIKAKRLQEQLERTEQSLALARASTAHEVKRRQAAERSKSAHRGVVTRMKRRIAAGRCVCCHSKFPDLQRHMREQHPDWNPEREATVLETKSAAPSGRSRR